MQHVVPGSLQQRLRIAELQRQMRLAAAEIDAALEASSVGLTSATLMHAPPPLRHGATAPRRAARVSQRMQRRKALAPRRRAARQPVAARERARVGDVQRWSPARQSRELDLAGVPAEQSSMRSISSQQADRVPGRRRY